jgi:hypothetical protein
MLFALRENCRKNRKSCQKNHPTPHFSPLPYREKGIKKRRYFMSDFFESLNTALKYSMAWKVDDEIQTYAEVDGVDEGGMHINFDSAVRQESEYVTAEEINCGSFPRPLFDRFVYGKPQELCMSNPIYQAFWSGVKTDELSREVPKREMEREIHSIIKRYSLNPSK